MTDIQLFVSKDADWDLDIDIIGGRAALLDDESANIAQRASVGAYMLAASVPGKEDIGVDWTSLFTKDATIIEVDNQTKRQIQDFATSSKLDTQSPNFIPMYKIQSQSVELQLFPFGG